MSTLRRFIFAPSCSRWMFMICVTTGALLVNEAWVAGVVVYLIGCIVEVLAEPHR